MLGCSLLLWGCESPPEKVFQGYAEGEYVLVASPFGARLNILAVQRGDQVEADGLLFVLDQVEEQAAVSAAEQEVKRAESQLEDLRKGQRPSELHAIEASVRQAQTTLDLAENEFTRRRNLLKQDAIAIEEFDRSNAAMLRSRDALVELKSQLKTAQLGARQDLVAAGKAYLDAVRARLVQARWALAQKSPRATQAARVFDTLFEPGEFVRAGYPVVSLLSPDNIIIRFFVPETLAGGLSVGQPVVVSFDGSNGTLPATISYISPQVEYTPPVIYSQETRAKLVFMVEARPDPAVATRFHPGQPVDVTLESVRD